MIRTNDILSKIIENKRFEVEFQKRSISLENLQDQAASLCSAQSQDTTPRRSMRKALAESASGIIAEFKRRSPSKGWIRQEAKIEQIIPLYQQAGAAVLSILTDEKFFGGTLMDLRAARPLVDLPILRKEFIIDEYQLYQTKIVGADAILLIAAALQEKECRALAKKAHQLGLEVLLEIHNEAELAYIAPDIDMVGINNRNLGTFRTAVGNSFRLVGQLPENMLLISESGISNADTVKQLRDSGFRGFLIGETFMKTTNPGETLASFIGQLNQSER